MSDGDDVEVTVVMVVVEIVWSVGEVTMICISLPSLPRAHSLSQKVQYLHHADYIVVMSGGKVKAQGTFRELSEQNQLPKAQLKPRKKAQTHTKDHPDPVEETKYRTGSSHVNDQSKECDVDVPEDNPTTSLMGKTMDEVVQESLAKMNDTSESAVDEAQDKGG